MTQPTWRDVWRAIVPKFTSGGLAALREALRTDDPRLIHGLTVLPCNELEPGRSDLSAPVEGACLVAYPIWQGQQVPDVGRLQRYFYEVTRGVDTDLRFLANWWDDCAVPRDEKRAAMLAELDGAGTTN